MNGESYCTMTIWFALSGTRQGLEIERRFFQPFISRRRIMKNFVFLVVLCSTLLAACGPSAEQITATAVMAQAQTETAAPTLTFTPTATPTITLTPTVTATLTPTPTRTPPP